MPVDYRVAGLRIRGFRGIPELDIDLPTNLPIHLIGGNNSGKSTVLDAVALALGGGGFYQFTPTTYDYFHDAEGNPVEEFTVGVLFEAAQDTNLPAVQGTGKPVPVHGIQVRGKTNRAGQLSHRRVLLDSEGAPITISPRTPLRGDLKTAYRDHGNLGWSPSYARLDEIRSHKPEIMHLEPQNLRAQLYQWRSGPLQRLSKILADQFLEGPWQFTYGGRDRPMPESMVRAHDFFREAVKALPFWVDDMRPKLEQTLSAYIGGQARFGLKPDIQTLQEWLAQQLVVSFAFDAGAAMTPLDRMGDGWQSLVRLVALDVLSQYPEQTSERVVLLFEEPETHLHPHLRRKLGRVLERLATQGWVVMTATHGPEFVSFVQPQKIVRLWRRGATVLKGEFETTDTTQEVRFQEKLDQHGNHEFLFSHRAVLCEGKDDAYALRLGLARLDLDLDALSVTIVDTGSVNNLPDYARMASTLGIPWCAVSDEDMQPDQTIKPNTARARRLLEQHRGDADISLLWRQDLETCLATPQGTKASPGWQAENIEPKTFDSVESDHPDYVATCRAVERWLQQ